MEDYCCPNMEYYITSNEEDLIIYSSDIRMYNFILHKNSKKLDMRQQVYFCPWCGLELPKYLNEEWGEILEKEYGLSSKDRRDDSKIPDEFKTDEWWKKRGL